MEYMWSVARVPHLHSIRVSIIDPACQSGTPGCNSEGTQRRWGMMLRGCGSGQSIGYSLENLGWTLKYNLTSYYTWRS